MEASPNTISRFFKAHVTNPDRSTQQPPTRIFGRDALLDHSGTVAVAHPLGQSSSKICGPPVIDPNDATITLIDFSQAVI